MFGMGSRSYLAQQLWLILKDYHLRQIDKTETISLDTLGIRAKCLAPKISYELRSKTKTLPAIKHLLPF